MVHVTTQNFIENFSFYKYKYQPPLFPKISLHNRSFIKDESITTKCSNTREYMSHHQARPLPLEPEVPESPKKNYKRMLSECPKTHETHNHMFPCIQIYISFHGLPPWSSFRMPWTTPMVLYPRAMDSPHALAKYHGLLPWSSHKSIHRSISKPLHT